jgi:predicted ribosome quality control (RQC) complex YloA/Tae2 family protein
MIIASFHQHYVCIERISFALSSILENAVLSDAFRHKEDELSLVFKLEENYFSLSLNTSCRQGLFQFFDNELSRSSGVQPLFESIKYKRVKQIIQSKNDRSFLLEFEQNLILLFKCYGPLSNVILFENNIANEAYRSSIISDFQVQLDQLDRLASEKLSLEIDESKNKLSYFVYKRNQQYEFHIDKQIEEEQVYFSYDILDAYTFFSQRYIQQYHFLKEKESLLKSLSDQIKRQEQVLYNNKTRLHYLENAINPEEIGHIIMANLHMINKGDEKTELFDFYRNEDLSIKLKKELSPQDNAAQYYRKAKNRKLEIEQAYKMITQAEEKLKLLKPRFVEVELAETKKALKQKDKIEFEQKNASGFKEFECDGFRIYVGRNSENNDVLTLKFAKKDDLWLHAKGVSGSHVIIKNQQKRKTPEHVIQRAAELAAYFSKSKSSGLVAVMVTEKKYVRKPKGALPGQVRVDREDVILAEPKLE